MVSENLLNKLNSDTCDHLVSLRLSPRVGSSILSLATVRIFWDKHFQAEIVVSNYSFNFSILLSFIASQRKAWSFSLASTRSSLLTMLYRSKTLRVRGPDSQRTSVKQLGYSSLQPGK